jgi:predicted MFS family arabinose efflux permease
MRHADDRSSLILLISGCLVLAIAMGIRQIFGLLLVPVVQATGWPVAALSLGFAIQQIVWGAAQPAIGALADTKGARGVLIAGATLYAGGLALMAYGGSSLAFQIGSGGLMGLALGCLSYTIINGPVARAAPLERRSFYLGITGAGGSFGMFAFVPIGQSFLGALGWQSGLLAVALLALLIIPLAFAFPKPDRANAPQAAQRRHGEEQGLTLAHSLRLAMRHDGFWLLTLGFFVCGFHVAFISVHLPGYITACGMPAHVGAWALALIGLFNIAGSLLAGRLGDRYRPKHLLSLIYATRGLAIALFMLAPKTPLVTLLFASSIGVLWLSTVPLTTGVVTSIFGPRYVSTLSGIVFFSHQVGGFLGAWSGGAALQQLGSYDAVWYISIILAALAALMHWPIRDARLPVFQGT